MKTEETKDKIEIGFISIYTTENVDNINSKLPKEYNYTDPQFCQCRDCHSCVSCQCFNG